MGLDQYAWAVDDTDDLKDVDQEVAEYEELHYWRKHPNLHGWMENLYLKKGGKNPEFNCTTVRLTVEDLDELESVVNANALPQTEGFFFGQSSPEDKVADLDFIEKARKAIKHGKAVYYDSWW